MPFLPLPPRTVGVGGRGMLVNSIHGVDTLRYVVVLSLLSTSNHNIQFRNMDLELIVLYCLSTSNHNFVYICNVILKIVLYRLSTSNHNVNTTLLPFAKLSYIVFLHQTTTVRTDIVWPLLLSYIVFLHQTTTHGYSANGYCDCLISSFYIKPQRCIIN